MVIPLLKAGKNPDDAVSYRHVSLLSTVARVTERIAKPVIRKAAPLPDFQHGFREGRAPTLHCAKVPSPFDQVSTKTDSWKNSGRRTWYEARIWHCESGTTLPTDSQVGTTRLPKNLAVGITNGKSRTYQERRGAVEQLPLSFRNYRAAFVANVVLLLHVWSAYSQRPRSSDSLLGGRHYRLFFKKEARKGCWENQ